MILIRITSLNAEGTPTRRETTETTSSCTAVWSAAQSKQFYVSSRAEAAQEDLFSVSPWARTPPSKRAKKVLPWTYSFCALNYTGLKRKVTWWGGKHHVTPKDLATPMGQPWVPGLSRGNVCPLIPGAMYSTQRRVPLTVRCPETGASHGTLVRCTDTGGRHGTFVRCTETGGRLIIPSGASICIGG